MKKKSKVLVMALVICLLLTGCTKNLTVDKKIIKNEETGQALTANILCLPESKDLLSQYEDYKDVLKKNYKVNIETLPKCSKMKVYDKSNYNGLWVQVFVRPLAWLIIKLGAFLHNYGLSVMLLGIFIRLLLLPVSAKSIKQQKAMQEIQPEMQRIQARYAGKDDRQSQMAMSQEMMALYSKYKVNPLSSCLVSLIQLPLFFAFLEAINRVPAIFENNFLSFQLGTTPIMGIKSGNYTYIILVVLIILCTFFSFKLTMGASSVAGQQQKQQKYMMYGMTVFIGIASIQLPAAIALYWVVTNLFNVVQTIILNKDVLKSKKKKKFDTEKFNKKMYADKHKTREAKEINFVEKKTTSRKKK